MGVALHAGRPHHARRASGAAPTLTVDSAAIAHNTRHFARLAPQVMAVVKADGYGHGAAAVARIALAQGATCLGVATAEEAIALRADGLSAPIVAWVLPLDAPWEELAWSGVDVAVASLPHLDRAVAAAIATGRRVQVHLHVDCGMAREGAAPADWAGLFAAALAAERALLIDVVGLMGHLAVGAGDGADARGQRLFHDALADARAVGLRPRHRHLAATAATLATPGARHTLCRIGAGLVGIDPIGGHGLREAMTLTAPVIAVRSIDEGDSSGYGHDWTATRPTRLATIPVGYADGLPRAAAGRAQVALNGRRLDVVGAISMDQTVVDVGDLPVMLGDAVTVWGTSGPSVKEWAAWASTIPHEIMTSVGARVRKVLAP
jgi:alanine racemase